MKAPLIVGVPAILGGVPGGAFLYTRESIIYQEDINSNVLNPNLPTGSNSSWKAKQEELKAHTTEIKDYWDIEALRKKLRETNGITEQSGEEGSHLKNLCLSLYSRTYKSIFSEEKSMLKEQVKRWCVHKIKSKLGEKALTIPEKTEETNKTVFEKYAKLIRVHKDNPNDGIIFTNNTFFSELKEIKETQDDAAAGNKWTSVQTWCAKVYNRGFRHEKDNLWILAQKYCVSEDN